MYALALHHRTMGLTPHAQFNISNEQTLRLPYALAIAAGSALSSLPAGDTEVKQ